MSMQPSGLLRKSLSVWPLNIGYSALFKGGYLADTTHDTSGVRTNFTISACVKRAATGTGVAQALLGAGTADDAFSMFGFSSEDKLRFTHLRSGTAYPWDSDAVFLDQTAHYHVVCAVDTTLADANERVKIWCNGVRLSGSWVSGALPQNYAYVYFGYGAASYQVGRIPYFGKIYSGYISNLRYVDGQSLDASAFGKSSARVPGLWTPTVYTGGYGVNGFSLDFADAADLGKDLSGNGHNLTAVGGVAQSVDTPTNNHCTLHPLDPETTGTLSGGNLTTTGNAKVTLRPVTGQWYYEKDGAGVSYDADVNGQFNPVLTAGTYNFGATAWQDTGPTGTEQSLCAENLPDPSILDTSRYTEVLLRDGTGVEATVGGLKFQPDFVVTKSRNLTRSWASADSVVGAGSYLSFDNDYSETADTESIKAFNTDGYVVGSNVLMNESGSNMLDWALKASVKSGFEVIRYTGDGIAGRQIAHTLGKTPTFIMVKRLDAAASWIVYHVGLGATKYLRLDVDDPYTVSGTAWNNTEPTASVFTVGTAVQVNAAGGEYVAYVFTDSELFRAFSFSGNGSSNGPFIDLGGRPFAMPFLKSATSNNYWSARNAVVNPFNPADTFLCPNVEAAEEVGNNILFLSNGFKVVSGTVSYNTSGAFSIGLAVLRQTNKYSNAF